MAVHIAWIYGIQEVISLILKCLNTFHECDRAQSYTGQSLLFLGFYSIFTEKYRLHAASIYSICRYINRRHCFRVHISDLCNNSYLYAPIYKPSV